MAESLKSFPVANMVQGVSQQAPQNRRETQCESQFDCMNSPVLGCEARAGVDFNSLLVAANYTDSFFYEIKRGVDEHYLVVVTKTGATGILEVFDLNSGGACTVTFEAGSEAYLATTAAPKDVFKATTVEDYTFLANREVVPVMDESNKSPARRNEAILYWRASAYVVKFQVAITYNGHVYTWSYQTPDNSTVGNAPYITTSAVAATFYRTMTGLAAVPTTSGATATSTNQGVGATFAGDAGTVGVVTGGTTAISLGFTLRLNGNVILISRSDNAVFSVDTSDGVGDTYLRAVQDTVQSFSQLPSNCFEGFTCKVKGTNKETADDYYTQFVEGDGSQGYWQEVTAPGVSYTFDPDSMPHALINTGPGTFTFQVAPWGFRLSGDGVDTAKDPSFVGKQIWDMGYDNNRLQIITEGASTWSKINDPFVYFPGSAQTTLATDPIDVKIGGGKQIVLLRKIVQTNESSFIWAQKAQFRVTSGQESFRQDTVASKKSTSYEFAETPDPLPVADSLYFATEPGRFATIRDLSIQLNGQSGGAADVTAHIQRYIPTGVRRIAASDTLGIMVLTTDAAPSFLYVYNFLLGTSANGAPARLQSAWNIWRLPNMGQVLYATIQANRMDMVIQRPEGVILATMDLSQELTDAGHDDFLTRMDLRITEANITAVYNTGPGTTTITLPYDMLEAEGDEARPIKERRCFVVTRTTSAFSRRGYEWPITLLTGNTIEVAGDASIEELYIGLRITAERTESRFFIRSPNGMVPAERIQVVNYSVTHSSSGYYRAEVTYNNGRKGTTEWSGRAIGDPNNLLGSFPILDGQLKVPVGSESYGYTLKLINDSFLPSRWQTSEYQYLAAFSAPPGGLGGPGGKQQ